jgi:alanine racemase
VEKDIVVFVVSNGHGAKLAAEARASGGRVRCHAKIDTGMGRLGFPWEKAGDQVVRVAGTDGLQLEGVASHFAASDVEDRGFADIQAERFRKVVEGCRERGVELRFNHMSNSGAIQRDGTWDRDGVRPGIMLYGYGPRYPGRDERLIETRPFLQWKTRVGQVRRVPAGFTVSYGSTHVTQRETCLATINSGYSDGYSRSLSNKGVVLIGGRRCRVVGRVTMNFTIIDVGPDSNVAEGDEVTLLGAQGDESVWAEEIAGWRDTVPHEVLTNIQTTDRRVVG